MSERTKDVKDMLAKAIEDYQRLRDERLRQVIKTIFDTYPALGKYAKEIEKLLTSGDEELAYKLLGLAESEFDYGLTILSTKKAKLFYTILALNRILSRGLESELYRALSEAEENLKRFSEADGTTLVRLYLALSLGYSSIGVFSKAFESAAKALRISAISLNVPEALMVLMDVSQLYLKAPQAKECRKIVEDIKALSKGVSLISSFPSEQIAGEILGRLASLEREVKSVSDRCPEKRALMEVVKALEFVISLYLAIKASASIEL